jgi:hypothetical protein
MCLKINKRFEQGSLTKGEMLIIVDLLVLTSLDQLLFILKIFFAFVTKRGGQPY